MSWDDRFNDLSTRKGGNLCSCEIMLQGNFIPVLAQILLKLFQKRYCMMQSVMQISNKEMSEQTTILTKLSTVLLSLVL